MDLTSGISKTFNKQFLLEEDALRRISAILEKAAIQLVDQKTMIVFHVEREDDRYYETSNIEDVLEDPNITGKKVCYTSIELRPIGENTKPWVEWIVDIEFVNSVNRNLSKKNFIKIRIASNNKSWALLLSDDLEPQILRTINKKITPRWLIFLFFVPFFYLGARYFFFLSNNWSQSFLNNFISIIFSLLTIFFLLPFFYLTVKGTPKWFFTTFGPESVFLWGEETKAYQDREKTRQNIQWGIIVTFLISLIGSIIYSFIFYPIK